MTAVTEVNVNMERGLYVLTFEIIHLEQSQKFFNNTKKGG